MISAVSSPESVAGDRIFAAIAELQAARPWGDVLDAGTGGHSLAWITGLPTRRWAAVTLGEQVAAGLRRELGARLRPQDRVLVGDWRDEGLLAGERFDLVLCDYLLGAVEGAAPFFQERLFARLRRHVAPGGRLVAVGLAPYPDAATCPWGRTVLAIARLRDAAITLAGERPFREHPLPWVVDRLREAGFELEAERTFPIRYGERFVRGQLRIVRQKLPRIEDAALGRALVASADALEASAMALLARGEACAFGEDWLVAARPVD